MDTCVLVVPNLRILANRRSTAFRRSPYRAPGWTTFRNSTVLPLPNGRLRLVVLTTPGMLSASAWPPQLWLWVDGNSFPAYGRLRNVPLTSMSIFGTLYVASPLMFVCQPDSRWQNCSGH